AKIIAEDADFQLIVVIGQYGRGGDLRAGSGSRRYTNQGPDWSGDESVAYIITRRSAMGQDSSGNLGQIHITAAAQTEHCIPTQAFGLTNTFIRCSKRRFRLTARENLESNVGAV